MREGGGERAAGAGRGPAEFGWAGGQAPPGPPPQLRPGWAGRQPLQPFAPPLTPHVHTLAPSTLTVNTNGNIVADEEMGEVIQLQGDQRQKVKEWILDQELVTVHEQDRIVIHGF